MNISTLDLTSEFASHITSVHGEHGSFSNLSGYQNSNSESLVFLQEIAQFAALPLPHPAVIITSETISAEIKQSFAGLLLSVNKVRLCHALVKQRYYDYQSNDDEWQQGHPTAVIHQSATLGSGCRVGPGAIIGADCYIGERVIIRATAVVEHGVTIGDDCIVNGQVNIGYDCILGARVTVQTGCVIGNEGFGFATDQQNKHHRIPHTGIVILEDDVHVGSNTCIDRGTYGATEIKRGVKIDNLCHIAHNVRIDEDCLITAQTVIAGSSQIGKRVITSGQTGILDHIKIADDAVLVHRAGVSQDIKQGGVWAGTPPRPIKEYVKSISLVKKVARLEQKIKELQKLTESL